MAAEKKGRRESGKQATSPKKAVEKSGGNRIVIPKQINSEVNTLKYPLFVLSRKGLKDQNCIEYREAESNAQGTIEKLWKVTANTTYGLPGPFDRKVFRAIESIISEMPKPISNPIEFSLYDLCQRMGINPKSGQNLKNVKQAIRRIKFTGITAHSTFYSKEDKVFFAEKEFNIYNTVVFAGQVVTGKKNEDPLIAEKNGIELHEYYLRSINSYYVKTLDYSYMKSLQSPIAERCYELLGVKFYGQQGKKPVRYLYSTLCDLLPIARQRYLSKAKEKLVPPLKELTDTGFLAKEPNWEPSGRKEDWYLFFVPGKRAVAEMRGDQKLLDSREAVCEVLPCSSTQSDRIENSKALEWVRYFYRMLYKSEDVQHQPTVKEISLAEKYLHDHGEGVLKIIIDDTLRYARTNNWDVRSFAAVSYQVDKTLARLHAQASADEEERVFRNDYELCREHDRYVKAEIERLKRERRDEYERIVAEEEYCILSERRSGDHEKFKQSQAFKDMLAHVVKKRLENESYVLSFTQWKETSGERVKEE